MTFLPTSACQRLPARIRYMRGDSTVLWEAEFNPGSPIPFYRGLDPIPGSYTVRLEWTEENPHAVAKS